LFKQRKHKRFNYKPRYSDNGEKSSNDVKTSGENEFVSKWQKTRGVDKSKSKKGFSVIKMIIILVLLLISMYLLEIKFMSN
jgi:hypothetical protein